MRLPQRAAPSLARALASARKRAAIGEDANSGLRSAPVFEWLRRAVETHSDPIEQRPPRHLTWSSRLLLIASVAVPMLLFAVAAWQNYRLVKIQAEQRVRIETRELEEHALRALETYSLVLAWIDGRIFGLDWDSIEYDRRLRRLLSDIETLPQIGSVSIVDTLGHIRASEPPLVELPEKVFAHDAFVAQESRDAGAFVGRTPAHHPTAVSFEISRRRSTADGSFDGVIIVSARPDYFSDFFSTVSAEKNFSASLVRRDGALLVRYPPLPGPFVFNADQPIMKAIAAERVVLGSGRHRRDRAAPRLSARRRVPALHRVRDTNRWRSRLVASQSGRLSGVRCPGLARIVLHDIVRGASAAPAEIRELALAIHSAAATGRDGSADQGRGRSPSGAKDGSVGPADWQRVA